MGDLQLARFAQAIAGDRCSINETLGKGQPSPSQVSLYR